MPTQTTAVRDHLQPSHNDFQPTASPSFSSGDSCKNLSSDAKADDAMLKELALENESQDDLDDSNNGRSPEVLEATSIQTRGPVGLPPAPARVFSCQDDPLFLPNSRPWYHQSSFPILVVAGSLFGNWLTGTDYITFMVFYIHQFMEGSSFFIHDQTSHLSLFSSSLYIYIKSRTRPRPLDSPSDDAALATSEPSSLETSFLFFVTQTPFIGALFVSSATVGVLGRDSVSWVNAILFVLAAGLRPWSHLVHLCQQEITELHEAVHNPSADLISTAGDGDAYSKIQTLEARVADLERASGTRGLYQYVDKAVDAVDRNVKRVRQMCERQEARVREVVEGLQGMKRALSLPTLLSTTTTTTAPSRTLLSRLITPRTWFAAKNRRSPPLPVNSMQSPTSSESTAVQHGLVSEEEEEEGDTPAPAARRQHQHGGRVTPCCVPTCGL